MPQAKPETGDIPVSIGSMCVGIWASGTARKYDGQKQEKNEILFHHPPLSEVKRK